MIWPAIERHVYTYLSPRWLETWRVRRVRRAVLARPAIAPSRPRRLFVDVSVISKHDAGTGIQRVVRAVATQLLENPPAGWIVQSVGATRKRPYHPISWSSVLPTTDFTPIEAQPGDVFLGLDFALDTIHFHECQLAAFKRQGGQLWFVMYDLLPIQRPDLFSDKLVVRYRKWLGVLAALADGFYCISPPVEAELRKELAQRYGLENGFRTHVLPIGWDLAASRPSTGVPAGFDAFLQRLTQRPTALMVGTIEPRKGHADVLAAFDILWQEGIEANLVIVGRPGWKTEALQAVLRRHPQYGERLFWLDEASDEALTKLYAACDGVIVASHAEGFGLPLIEALGHGKYVLARDLPVFRLHEVRSSRITYFSSGDAVSLSKVLTEWFDRIGNLETPLKPESCLPEWKDTAFAIVTCLDETSEDSGGTVTDRLYRGASA
jgi:glycosyltransferase involved in cell wall biosynthesis